MSPTSSAKASEPRRRRLWLSLLLRSRSSPRPPSRLGPVRSATEAELPLDPRQPWDWVTDTLMYRVRGSGRALRLSPKVPPSAGRRLVRAVRGRQVSGGSVGSGAFSHAPNTFFQDAGARTARTAAPRLSNRDVIMGRAPWGTGFAQVFNDLLNEVGPSAPFPTHSSMHSTLPGGPSPPVHSLLLPDGCRLICTDLDHRARSLPPIRLHPRRPQNTVSSPISSDRLARCFLFTPGISETTPECQYDVVDATEDGKCPLWGA
jgi:hypothetical protein